ncbi:MuF-like minor capsid protein [Microbacterium phage Mercedes]|nr:MuF-like minor capsid protein [Microbacterium phage Mercedes]
MATVPTGRMERELRKLYLQWLMGLPAAQDLPAYIALFEQQSRELIGRMGGRVASLGALGDFPASKYLELSPVAGVIYNGMEQAAIQAGLIAGLGSVDVAKQMFRLGLDKSFNRLRRLARTETTNAYWKNTWDSTAGLPGIILVWSSETGPRTCDWCRSRDGLVVEDPNIRDHPNGRCTLVPKTRSLIKYRGTLQADGSVYMDPRWGGSGVAKLPAVAGKPRAAAPGVLPAAPIQGAS